MEIGNWKLVERLEDSGAGVICETRALQAAVIPVPPWRDGNDRRFERDPIPNDTTTRIPNLKYPISSF
jgi:hypothetical protein